MNAIVYALLLAKDQAYAKAWWLITIGQAQQVKFAIALQVGMVSYRRPLISHT